MLRPGFALALATFWLVNANAVAAPIRRAPAGLIVIGVRTEGDAPSRFNEDVDLRTGNFRRTQQMGDSEAQFGFDGQPWDEANDIVTITTLPSAVAHQRTRAWLDSRGWQTRASHGEHSRRIVPPGGSDIELAFDPVSGLLRQAIIDGDWGPINISFSDWRRVGPFTYPFHREEVSSTGERTVTQVESVRAVPALAKGRLLRPRARSHAQLTGDAPATIAFTTANAKRPHIIVDAMINDQPARLVFDTGAAFYLTTDAAPRFGVHPQGGINLGGVGESSTTGGYATVDRVALGTAALRKHTLVVGPSPFPPANGKQADVDGFAGYEFVAEYVTTIDYPARTLNFARSLPRQGKAIRVPFYNDGFHMYVHARVNGVDGLFGVDTGDGGTVTIFPAFASRSGIHGPSGPAIVSGGGVGGAVRSQSGTLDRFSLGGLNFDQLPADFSQNKTGAFASKSIAGNLGGAILQCFRITIDFPHHFLLLDPVPQSPYCAPGGSVTRV